MDVPTGSIRISVSTAACTRSDGAQEDDFKSWAGVYILSAQAKHLAAWWYAPTTPDAPDANFSKTSISNGYNAAYNYVRASKPIPLTSASLSAGAAARLVIILFKGDTRDASKSVALGYHSTPLAPLLAGEKLKGKVTLSPLSEEFSIPGVVLTPSPVVYQCALTFEARGDTPFEEYALGSRLLHFQRLELHSVPRRWRLPSYEWEDVEDVAGDEDAAPSAAGGVDHAARVAMCDDPDENFARYVLSVRVGTAGEVKLSTGTLRYVQRESSAWTWSVVWQPQSVFVSAADATHLQQHIAAGGTLDATLRRVLTELVDDDDPLDTVFGLEPGRRLLTEDYAYRALARVPVDALLPAGAASVEAEVNIIPVDVSDAEKSADAAAKTARDAAWAEYTAAKAKSGAAKGAANAKKPKDKDKAREAKAKEAAKAKEKAKAGAGKAGAAAGKGGKAGTDAVAEDDAPASPMVHVYTALNSVLALRLEINVPLQPRPPTPPPAKLTAADLISARPPPLAAPPGLDASQTFRREIANATYMIAAEYKATMERIAARQAASPAAAALPEDERRKQLLSAIKASGVYDRMKAALKSSAIQIIKERFAHLPGAADPPGSRGRDMFVSYLYAYLIGQMHAALNASIAEAEATAAISALPPGAQPRLSSNSGGAATSGAGEAGESVRTRLLRIALECEFVGRYARAERVHQTRVTQLETDAAHGLTGGAYDLNVWNDYALFYLRRGQLLKASTCLKEALSIDAGFVPTLLAMAVVQCARGQLEDALVFADSALDVVRQRTGSYHEQEEGSGAPLAVESPVVNVAPLAFSLLSIVHTLKEQSTAAGHRMLDAINAYRRLLAAHGVAAADVESAATAGGVYLLAARFLLSLPLPSLARKALELASNALEDTDAPRTQNAELLVLRARWFMAALNAEDARELSESSTRLPLTHPSRQPPGSTPDAVPESPLLFTIFGERVPISVTGEAYDAAPLTVEQASRCLERACELDRTSYEAWALRAQLVTSCLTKAATQVTACAVSEAATSGAQVVRPSSASAAAATRASASIALPLCIGGAPDIADLSAAEAAAALSHMQMAASHVSRVLHCGYNAFHPSHAIGALSAGAALPADTQAAAAMRTASGVGGACVLDDGHRPTRLHLAMGNLHLHLFNMDDEIRPAEVGVAPVRRASQKHAAAARNCYLRAAEASKAPICLLQPGVGAPTGSGEAVEAAKPWALTLLGIGRLEWANNEPTQAEAVLSEANVLDNQNPVVWAWLAFVCLSSEPPRSREASTAVDQALKLGLVGDSNETTALLHTLADKYREIGSMPAATNLLRRACALLSAPASVAHMSAMLEAKEALGAVLADSGAVEEAIETYRTIMNMTLPAQLSLTSAEAGAAVIEAAKKNVTTRERELLASQGR